MSQYCPHCRTQKDSQLFVCKSCSQRYCFECGEAASEKSGRTLTLKDQIIIILVCPGCGSEDRDQV